MTIKQHVSYSFECELCTYRDEPRLSFSAALLDRETHFIIGHPEYAAERAAAGLGVCRRCLRSIYRDSNGVWVSDELPAEVCRMDEVDGLHAPVVDK